MKNSIDTLATPLPIIMDANPVPCFVIDAEHRITHWNRGCEQILGLPASRMIGTSNQWQPFYAQPRATMADLIVDQGADGLGQDLYGRKRFRRSAAIEGAYEAEDFFPHLGEQGRWLFFTAAPILDADGKIIGAVETLQDVSRQREAELALQASHDALERKVAERTAELAASLEKAETANRLKSAFLATVSHELKTPLNSIIGFSDLIAMDHPDDAEGDYARLINESGKNLLHLVSAMLTMTELEAGEAERSLQLFDLHELIDGLAIEFSPMAQSKGIRLLTRLPEDHSQPLESDPYRVRQVLSALIDNAIRYMNRPDGEIVLAAHVEGEMLEVTVSDNGPGIPEGGETLIFEKFRQLEGVETRCNGGLGLGLALARAQIEFLNGHLTLVPQPPGQGTCMRLSVPVGITAR